MTGQNIGDLHERGRRDLGLVPGRLQADRRTPAATADLRRARTRTSAGARGHRLHPAPRAVPVLRLDGATRTTCRRPRGDDRHDRPGQPPVRPDRLRRGAGGRQPPAGLVPQGRPPSRTATPATPGRSTSSTSSSRTSTRSSSRRSGPRPRSSSPTTTPTAGTTTSSPPIAQAREAPSDALNGAGICGARRRPPGGFQDRCGPGPRLPLLVISPWAKPNYVDHTRPTRPRS